MTSKAPSPARLRHWTLALGLVLATLLAAVVGWNALRDGVGRWLSGQHISGAWAWKVWGIRRGGSVLAFDSLSVRGPSLRLKLRAVRIQLQWIAGIYPVPASLSIHARRLDILPLPGKPDTSAPAFPHLSLPLAVRVVLDSFFVRTGDVDTGRTVVSVQGIGLESEAGTRATAKVRSARSPSVAASAGASLEAQWTESDTLRLRLRIVAASGCCASDTLEGDASLSRKDLRLGRARMHGRVEESRGWSDVLPALAKAPALHGIDLDLSAFADRTGRNLHAKLGFATDSIAVLEPLSWIIEADLAGREAKLRVLGNRPGAKQPNLDLRLEGRAPRSKGIEATQATGTASVQGLGMLINGFDHPFDSDVKILSLDAKGANVDLVTAAGSVVRGQVVWKGLHWVLDGDIAAGEPWAQAWADSLRVDGGGHAHGEDSAGTALFDVVARNPGIRMVHLDSLSTHVRIALPGPRLTFSGIEARDSSHLWTGHGNISIPDSVVHFELSPFGDTAARADLDVHIGGPVLIRARDFPSEHLPLRLAGLPTFPLLVDAEFRRDPPAPGASGISVISASARGRPFRDSLHAALSMSIADSSLEIGAMRVSVGNSHLDGGLALARTTAGWTLDTLRISTDSFDLLALHGLVPGLPDLGGRLYGHILSQRGQGVSADLRLDRPTISRPDGKLSLPDMVLWGERDTLHLGGWWPLAGSRTPFRITATHLWDPSPEFDLLAFWGDVVRLHGHGVFRNRRDLVADATLDGSSGVPGTEARLMDLLVQGHFQGEVGASGFSWKAQAEGKEGELQALAGNPLDLRFHVEADPAEIHLVDAELGGPESGMLYADGRYGLIDRRLSLDGHARSLHFDLGSGKQIDVDSLVVAATSDSRMRLEVQGVGWHQAWNRSERLDVHVSTASLAFAQAKDWRKLSGDVTVDKVLFTRNFADPKELWNSARQLFAAKRRSTTANTSSIPTLLDVRIASEGDSIRISDNLGQARLGFDLQVAGPLDAPLLNGFLSADTEGGHFGYLKRDFHIDTLRADWNTQPVAEGRFQLAGFRNILKTCQETGATTPSNPAMALADSCELRLSAEGTLDQPRLRSLTSDCATQPGDDGTGGAAVALATGCYPQSAGGNFGTTLESAGTDFVVNWGMDQVNEYVANGLRRSREGLVWLPDSVALTDLPNPTSTTRDQLGLIALYHITPELDLAGTYQHNFAQTTAIGSIPQLPDNYGASLKYHIPFGWIEDTATRARLEHRVFLQVDFGEALDNNYRTEYVVEPSLRYHWGFW
jgi:hypothetical protein